MAEAVARTHSNDSVTSSEEFECLGSKIEILVSAAVEGNKPSPEIEIGNNGSMDDLQETLNEVLDEEATPAPIESEDSRAIFNRIAYLGAATVNAPRGESELQRNMAILSRQSGGQPIEVSLTVPANSSGSVVLYEASSGQEMARYPIQRIIYFAKGPAGTPDASCFAFTCPRGDSDETAIFQCHVFRCQIPEAVPRVMSCFVQAFHSGQSTADASCSTSSSEPAAAETSAMAAAAPGSSAGRHHELVFDVTLEIREEDSKGNYGAVPKDRNYFKIRSGVEKKVVITVQQQQQQPQQPQPQQQQPQPQQPAALGESATAGVELPIERCFGLLVAAGRDVKNSDMHLLEMVSMGTSQAATSSSPAGSATSAYVISGHWDPNEPVFSLLNKETTRDISCVYMTIAVDLVIRGISEPVRFVMETRVKVFGANERFWYASRKQANLQYTLRVAEDGEADGRLRVLDLRSDGEVERTAGRSLGSTVGMALSLNLSSLSTLTSSTFGSLHSPGSKTTVAATSPADEPSDNDEPLLSGSGEVSKDCTELELASWAEVLQLWNGTAASQRPRQLDALVRRGIPEALRGEVWLRLSQDQIVGGSSGVGGDADVMDRYRVLITRECSADAFILRDIHRTFPAHDFFKDSGGLGQEALAKISRAYAVYDQEVGYCQGLSFLAAALLLHMPEEQAFCVLVRVMYHYGLRDLFKDGFETLHLRLYQLDRLIEDNLGDLWNHLVETGIESHMYASQWFLTLFTAKFPLFLVFHILDVFLCQGMDTIFQVALGLLSMARKDLLALNFEGILKYFRVQLPKRYRNEEAARQLMKLTSTFKMKKIKKYHKDWLALKELEQAREDPLVRLERENKHLREANLRLERESDDLAQELIASKIGLRAELDAAEERADAALKELHSLRRLHAETDQDRTQIAAEAAKVKDMLKREVERAEDEARRNKSIIGDYKAICTRLGQRLELQQAHAAELWQLLRSPALLAATGSCSDRLEQLWNRHQELTGVDQPASPSRDRSASASPAPADPTQSQFQAQVRQLELELAQTKLALVEAECRSQDLTHQLTTVSVELQASSRNNWLTKTLSSIKKDLTDKS